MLAIITVYSITETAHPYLWDFDMDITVDDEPMRIPFTYNPSDPEKSTVAVGQWWADNPEFPVDPYVPPAVNPYISLAPYQFRAMLDLSGKGAALTAFINSLPEPNQTIARNKLEYSLAFNFDNDLVQAARQAMAIPMPEFQALWLQAVSIQ